jgi:hypothetical protein
MTISTTIAVNATTSAAAASISKRVGRIRRELPGERELGSRGRGDGEDSRQSEHDQDDHDANEYQRAKKGRSGAKAGH